MFNITVCPELLERLDVIKCTTKCKISPINYRNKSLFYLMPVIPKFMLYTHANVFMSTVNSNETVDLFNTRYLLYLFYKNK